MLVADTLVHFCYFFFFNDTATTEIYTLSLHDALPILPRFSRMPSQPIMPKNNTIGTTFGRIAKNPIRADRNIRSEEHTSELQSQSNLVCRLLLEKKNGRNGRRTSLV